VNAALVAMRAGGAGVLLDLRPAALNSLQKA